MNLALHHTIEHTLLNPAATHVNIVELCQEAIQYRFYAVCVNSCWIGTACKILEDSPVKIFSTAAFPLGASATPVKCREVEYATSLGAAEVDFVLNIGWLKAGDYNKIAKEFYELVEAASGSPLKVILETCLLTDQEKIDVCKLAVDTGIAFVKTSTGFGSGGATVDDIKLMRRAVGTLAGVKASGGIRDLQTAIQMIEAGADRIGTSSGVKIVQSLSPSPS